MFTGRFYLEVYPCHGFINENRYHEIVPKHLINHLYASNKKATARVAFCKSLTSKALFLVGPERIELSTKGL